MKKLYIAILVCLVLVGVFYFLIVRAATGNVIFTSDVILDLSGLSETLYIESGSTSNSISISGSDISVLGVPKNESFVIKSIDTTVINIFPKEAAANFSISSANILEKYLSQFKVNGMGSIDYIVGVAGKNTEYTVKRDGMAIGPPINSGESQQLNFTYSVYGVEQTFTIVPPPCEDHNIWGEAWSDGAGWIRFRCPTLGSGVDYGVDYNQATGALSGYAWSNGLGWISFNSSDLAGCPSGTCTSEVNLQSGVFSGWARVVSAIGAPIEKTGGWEGWISLKGSNYGLNVVNGSPSEVAGFAWSDGLGWISFNHLNCDLDSDGFSDGIGGCPVAGTIISDYKVYTTLSPNTPPTATNLTAVNFGGSAANCGKSEPPIKVEWKFVDPGDTQGGYDIQIDNDSDFSSIILPEINSSNSSPEQALTGIGLGLEFGHTYYWRIKVYDSHSPSADSGWLPTPSDPPASFITNPRWPNPNFTWSPAEPLAEQDVQFTNSTSYCASCSYSWNFGDGTPTSSITNPIHEFSLPNNYSVNLTATSAVGSCSKSNTITIEDPLPLPVWQETIPF
ncbi:PKD domain-containing protein [Patescibacteria group bacterium]|nr:PKD domain-containing protein [Patescibacteria group bacterium]